MNTETQTDPEVEHVVAALRERMYGQILQAAAVPALILVVAGFGVMDTPTAVWAAMWFLVAEMGLIAFLAVHRAGLVWWQQVLAVLLLVGAGAAVVAVKMIAHH